MQIADTMGILLRSKAIVVPIMDTVVKNGSLKFLVLLMIASAVAHAAGSEEDRKARQAELDAACEAAREAKLERERVRLVEECVENEQRSDRASCERFYADYGARTNHRGPLFYDLPECEKAHEYRTSYRR
jgi:hypothetical protein